MCKALQDLYDEGLEKGIEEGIQKGLEEGLEKGLEKGMQKGLEEGIREGAETERMEIAKRLIGVLDTQMIAEKVGLSVEQVMSLETELGKR